MLIRAMAQFAGNAAQISVVARALSPTARRRGRRALECGPVDATGGSRGQDGSFATDDQPRRQTSSGTLGARDHSYVVTRTGSGV
jgi:hypothetical protein